MENHLDHDYTKLQVALESFAWWLVQSKGEDELVHNKKQWEAWIKANKETIQGFAKPGHEPLFFDRVRTAYKLGSGKVVETAFASFGVTLLPEMQKELKGRNEAVHRGLMAPNREHQRFGSGVRSISH